jgi:hypothetical protein
MFKSPRLHLLKVVVIASLVMGSAWAADHHDENESHPALPKAARAGSDSARATSSASAGAQKTVSTSFFDALGGQIAPVPVTVEVHGTVQQLNTSAPPPFQSGGAEIVSSAGTFGDVSRFLQLYPGVVAGSDMSNEMFVRGGHPMENLFLVDGIEIPNINSLAMAGTTGGFGPMMDSALVQRISLLSGGYDARYPDRLSSITEITTLDDSEGIGRLEGDLGIQGFGGIADRRIGAGDLLLSAHHGIINALGGSFGSELPTFHVSQLSRKNRGIPGTLASARSLSSGHVVRTIASRLVVPALRRTGHPFAASGR